jgi:hypothetical protein
MSRLSKVKEKNPELLTNPEVVDLAQQADHLHDIKALAESNGGKALVKILFTDVVHSVRKLGGMYTTATHAELVSQIARMDAHLSTARLIVNAKDNLEYLDSELAEMLRE